VKRSEQCWWWRRRRRSCRPSGEEARRCVSIQAASQTDARVPAPPEGLSRRHAPSRAEPSQIQARRRRPRELSDARGRARNARLNPRRLIGRYERTKTTRYSHERLVWPSLSSGTTRGGGPRSSAPLSRVGAGAEPSPTGRLAVAAVFVVVSKSTFNFVITTS
jgi:hypothetical protein